MSILSDLTSCVNLGAVAVMANVRGREEARWLVRAKASDVCKTTRASDVARRGPPATIDMGSPGPHNPSLMLESPAAVS